MTNQIKPLLIVLLVIFSFLAGSSWMKWQQTQKQQAKPSPSAAVKAGQQAPFTPTKTDKPEVKFFMMSFCPFGNQAEAGLKPVANLLGNKATWEPVYILGDAKESCNATCQNQVFDEKRCQQLIDAKRVPDMEKCREYFPYNDADTCLAEKCSDIKEGEFDSLHGEQELHQDIRELCAWNLGDEAKYWDFVEKTNANCTYQNADECWQAQAEAAGFNTNTISQCEQNNLSKIAKEQIAITDKFRVSGSPTIYINGVLYNGGRQPEDYKKAICSSFTSPPKECDEVLPAAGQANTGSCN